MTQHSDDTQKHWIQFDRRIDLGHLIAMMTFIGGLFLQWNIMDKRVTLAEEKLAQTANTQQEIKSNNRDNYLELKIDVKEMKQTLAVVQQTLAVLNAHNQQNQRK